MRHKMGGRARRAIIILLWLAVWQIVSSKMDNPILLVGPVQTAQALMHNLMQPGFLKTILYSFARIGLGFFSALFAGLCLGAAGYLFPIVKELLSPVIQTMKSIPVASFVVLLLIWSGSGRLSFFISFLIVFPNVYVNTIAGLESADEKLLEMAQVFHIGWRNRFFYIYKPALMPYLTSCLKISLGMSWKSGVAAEVIGLTEYSMGERLYLSKIYLDTAGLFAWTFTIVLVSFLFEKAVFRLSGLIAAWKPDPASCRAGGMRRYRTAEWHDGIHAGADARTVTLSHINKAYGSLQILQDYHLTIHAGGRYVLMAPSGAGKTTLLRILTGLDNTDEGVITGMPAYVGMVFQEDRLCEEYDALCNIMLGMSGGRGDAGAVWDARMETDEAARADRSDRNGTPRRSAKRQEMTEPVRREACQILPEDCLTKPVNELSGGMRRRVALLRALLAPSDMVILDEPFAGLDEESRLRCAGYILQKLGGRTLLATTHREEDAALLTGTKITLY